MNGHTYSSGGVKSHFHMILYVGLPLPVSLHSITMVKLQLNKRKRCRKERIECVEFVLQSWSGDIIFQSIPCKLSNGVHIHFCHDAGPVCAYGGGTEG
jgi:hypothetical protein